MIWATLVNTRTDSFWPVILYVLLLLLTQPAKLKIVTKLKYTV